MAASAETQVNSPRPVRAISSWTPRRPSTRPSIDHSSALSDRSSGATAAIASTESGDGMVRDTVCQ